MNRLFTHGAETAVIEMQTLEGRPLAIPLEIRELLWGDKAVLVEMSAPAGFKAEPHAHEHESLVYVISGRIRATVEDETRELGPGDAVLHPVGRCPSNRGARRHALDRDQGSASATWPTRRL